MNIIVAVLSLAACAWIMWYAMNLPWGENESDRTDER